jgi:hypothetical protein
MVNFRKNPNLKGESIIDNSELIELLEFKLQVFQTRVEYYTYNPEELGDGDLDSLNKELMDTEEQINYLQNL